MSFSKWLASTIALILLVSVTLYVGTTGAFFADITQSEDNALRFRWGETALNDGFEDYFPWDLYWSDNGATGWFRDPDTFYSGSYSAGSDSTLKGYFTTNDIDASEADNLTISFRFLGNYKLSAGECVVELYNGTSYVTWYDITSYPGYTPGSWFLFSEVISDPSYMFAGFRLRFNTSNNNDNQAKANVDDVHIATDTVPPAVPTGLSATAGDKKVYLDWNDNTENDLWGYNIYRSTTDGTGYVKINTSPASTSDYTDSGVSNNTTYYYVIKAIDYGSNESAYSNQDYAMPVEMAPAIPTGLTATAGEFKADLDWNDNTDYDLAGYRVYRSQVEGGPYTLLSDVSGPIVSNYSDTDVTVWETYYYVVTAYDTKANESAYSAEVFAVPTNNPPIAPTGLIATAGDLKITLDWDNNTDDDLAGYNVYRSLTSGSGYSKINIEILEQSAYIDTGLIAGTTYYYVVRAVDETDQESGNSNQAQAVPFNSPPSAPINLAAFGGNSVVELAWNENTESDLAGYSVYRSLSNGGPYTKITPSLISSSNHTDTGLVNGTTYYYVITATDNVSQESSYSNQASAVPGDPPPSPPTGLTAIAGDKHVILDWNNNFEGDLNGYNVYRSLTSGGPYTKVNVGLVYSSGYTDTGLTGNTTYYYAVTAVDFGANESGLSNQASAMPTDPPPATPTSLTRTVASHTVYLNWNQNTETDMQGYNIYRSLVSGGPYTKINGSLVTTNSYTDTGLTNETPYYYVVTSVDLGGNESGNSNQVRAVPFAIPVSLFYDGFEGTPWDDQWNDIAPTGWILDSSTVYSGTYSARSDPTNKGYLTTDDIDASLFDEMTVSFWFYGGWKLDPGECLIDFYNGSEYVTQYDIMSYSGYTAGAWFKVTQLITNPDYLIDNFRLRFNTVALSTSQAFANVDEVLIIGNEYTDTIAPSAPTGLTSAKGDTEVYLDWNFNPEYDLYGYNIYRSTTNGTGYAKINGSLIFNEYYTDTGLTNGTTYYYVITAVDYALNESGYSNQTSQAPEGLPPAVPTGLTATAGEFLVSLDWNDNIDYDFAGYNVYRSTTSGTDYSMINTGLVTSSNYTDTGLNAGTFYYYVVTAVDDDTYESGYSNEAFASPFDNPPAAPTGLMATPGNRQILLAWDENIEDDLNHYNVYRSTTSGSGYDKVNMVPVLSANFTDTGLDPTVTYYYIIRAIDDGDNMSAPSNQASAMPDDDPPEAPTNLSATAGDRQIFLTWDENTETDVAGYNLYRSTTNGTGYMPVNVGIITTSNFTDTELFGGVTYYYVVTAVDDGTNESEDSEQAYATPYDTPPAAPTGLTATAGPLQVYLEWDANNTEVDFNSYSVYRSTINGTGYVKITGNVTDINYRDTGLTAGVTYYYVVRAVDNGSNESDNSNQAYAEAEPGLPPATPTGLDATAGDRQAFLDWDDNIEMDLAGYTVYRSLTSGTGYSMITTTNTTSEYTDTGLIGNVTYYYVVKALNTSFLESDNFSDEASALVYDNPPNAPTGLTATAGERQISLNWNDNTEDDFSHYNVYRSLTSGSGFEKINSTNVSSSDYLDSGLIGGVTYYYVVRAIDNAGNTSNASDEAYDEVYDNPPSAPAGLFANAGVRQISLDWDNNTEDDFNYYNVYRSLSSNGTYQKVNAANVTASNYTDTGLSGGVTYYYKVTAVDNAENESMHSTIAYTAALSAPPTNLMAASGDKQASLNWDDNVIDSLSHYNVYRSTTSGSGYAKINASNVTDSEYLDTGLTNGVTYYYVVTTVDIASYESTYSNEADVMPIGNPPDAPTGLTATRGINQVSLNWNDNTEEDLDGYNIYRSTTSGSGYAKVNASVVLTSDYIDTTVAGGTRYYYVVRAVNNAAQESGNSNEANARPIGPPTVLLNDGFETGAGNWDGNGSTLWTVSSLQKYAGSNSIYTGGSANGLLTTDDLNTYPGDNVTVSFWYQGNSLQQQSTVTVSIYNGTGYTQLADLRTYTPKATSGTWKYFSETFTYSGSPQYFITNFRLQLNSTISTNNRSCYIDEVVIAINQ